MCKLVFSPDQTTKKIGPPDAESRLATIEYIYRIQSDNWLFIVVLAGGKAHVLRQVYIDDLSTPTRFSRELLRKTSLLLAPCAASSKDGHWPRAKWNQLIADRMRVFRSQRCFDEVTQGFKTWEEFLASDKAQFRPDAG